MAKLISSFFQFATKSIFVATLLCFLVSLLVFLTSYPETFSVIELVWFPIGICICYAIIKIGQWLEFKSEAFTINFLSLLSVLLYAIVLLTFNTQPVSDYKVIWDSAVEMANGNFNAALLAKSDYMYIYNWNVGMAALESLFVRLFSDNFTVLKVFSALCTVAISYLVYITAKAKTELGTARIIYTLTALFLPYIMAVGQFSNHQIGTVFLLLSLYCIDRNTYTFSALGGIFAALLNVCRAIAVVIIIAAICLFVYKVIKERQLFRPFTNLMLVISCFLLVTFSFNQVFIKAGYTDGPITSPKIPYFKFHKGLTGYDSPFADIKKFDGDLETFNSWEKEQVVSAMQNQPVQIAVFVTNKMCRYLGLLDYQFEHTYNHDSNIWQRYPIKAFYSMGWIQYIFYVFLALIGYQWWSKRHGLDIYQIWFVGNTLVYIFLEAFTSYRFEHYIFIFLMAGCGLQSKLWKKFFNKADADANERPL